MREENAVIRSYLNLAINANIADVNFSHRTIAVREPLEPILNKLLHESCRLIP